MAVAPAVWDAAARPPLISNWPTQIDGVAGFLSEFVRAEVPDAWTLKAVDDGGVGGANRHAIIDAAAGGLISGAIHSATACSAW